MERRKEQRIFREVLSALIGSKLTSHELRELADLLASNRSFAYELGRTVYELSKKIEPQSSIPWPEEVEAEEERGDEGLVDLAYTVVQRRRMPKRSLISLIRSVSPRLSNSLNDDMPARQLLSVFFAGASTSQAQTFLRELGMDVAEDPYLGGIANRSRK